MAAYVRMEYLRDIAAWLGSRHTQVLSDAKQYRSRAEQAKMTSGDTGHTVRVAGRPLKRALRSLEEGLSGFSFYPRVRLSACYYEPVFSRVLFDMRIRNIMIFIITISGKIIKPL